MLEALKVILLLCAAASLAHESITPDNIKDLEKRLRVTEKTLQELKRENEALRSFTQAFEIKLESLQAENKAERVAFTAGLSASELQQTGPFNDQRTLVYRKVFTNIGNAYNPNTGIFTAPVPGVYFFRFYAHSHPKNRMAVSLYKNSERQCSVYSHMPETNANGSNGVVLTLEKGNEVYTQLWEKSWVYDDDKSFTSFSGFLLFTLSEHTESTVYEKTIQSKR